MSKQIPFFWIAFYKDKTCLPQFDLETGKQNSFKLVQEAEKEGKLESFGLFPIPFDLVKKLGEPYYYDGKLTHLVLKLKESQRLIGGIRTETQRFFTYSECLKCGFKWQWIPLREDGSIGDAGLPIYGEKYSYHVTNGNKEVFEVICPKCGARNDLKCPDCDEFWNKVKDVHCVNLPQNQWTYHYECPKCKKVYEKKVASRDNHTIDNVFLLGCQSTEDGINKKMIMYIDKNGKIELGE
jgi:Zn finger protein HypA/HybF involved in hydrogenase expression